MRRVNPEAKRAAWNKWYSKNRVRIAATRRARQKAYWAEHPEELLWRNARARAKLHGLPFSISVEDVVIPERCPVLGIPLRRGEKKFGPSSPSLDKKIPALGYVPGNVTVISWRANEIKSNATPEELRVVAAWVSK